MDKKTINYINLCIFITIAAPFLLFFGCKNPLDTPEDVTGITGVVTIAGMEDTSGVLVTAEPVISGKTVAVYRKLGLEEETADAETKSLKSSYTAFSGSDGTYTLIDLPEGTYTVSAQKDNTLGAVETDIVVTTKEVTQVDIELTATGSIEGNVTLEGATEDPPTHFGTIVYIDGTSYMAVTDGNGDFTMSDVPVSTSPHYTLVFYHAGFTSDQFTGVQVTTGTTTDINGQGDAFELFTTPYVVSTIPRDGATGVDINSSVFVYFSENMSDATIMEGSNNSESFLVFKVSGGDPLTGTYSNIGWEDGTTHSYSFTPTGGFEVNTEYAVILEANIMDPYEQHLSSFYRFEFTTTDDTTPPEVGNLVANATFEEVLLTWAKAIDNVTAQNLLEYNVYCSDTYTRVNSIAAMDTYTWNKIWADWQVDLTPQMTHDAVTSGTTYWFNIMVRDEAGNKNHYGAVNVYIPYPPHIRVYQKSTQALPSELDNLALLADDAASPDVDYGEVAAGGSVKDWFYYIENNGGYRLEIDSIDVVTQPSDDASWSVSEPESDAIDPGTTQEFVIRFMSNPYGGGDYTTDVSISVNDPDYGDGSFDFTIRATAS